MFRYTDRVCKKCLLQNDPLHKITLNAEGLCSLCAKPASEAQRDWVALEKRFAAHLDQARGARPYEGLIMLSGGKDSAYLADLLKNRYSLRLLGFIVDINYEYPETFTNAQALARKLELPFVVFRQDPKIMRSYYRFLFTEKALLQPDCGQVCTFCGRFLIHSACTFAKCQGIPLVFSGHNPDQIFLMGESIHHTPEQEILIDFLMASLAEETGKAQTLWQEHYGNPELPLFPDSIHAEEVDLLFPFQYFPYQPEEMQRHVRERLHWQPIKRFSKTYIASGCRLVKLWAYMAALNQTNSYVDFEFCNQIRRGALNPDTVRRFYEQAEVDDEELAELIVELDMVDAMKEFLVAYGEKTASLRRLLP